MKFIVVSDIHLTQYDGFPKQSNISERSLLLLKNFIHIKKYNDSDDLILLVIGDWFDNINKIHSIDLQITNMIFNLFKKVIFINGNHDLYSSSHSKKNQNFKITSGDILSSNKKVLYFDNIKLININSNTYFWLLSYQIDNTSVLPQIENKLKELLNSNKYNNESKHYFFSHLSIDEVEKTFFNHEKDYFKYYDFVKLMEKYKIDFEFFQGHYHLKTTEDLIKIKRDRFHIISTFPKNFSDVIKNLDYINNFGYYEINPDIKEFYFQPFEELFIFYEMNYNDDNITQLLNYLKQNKKHHIFLKLVVNELDENKLVQIENIKSYVKKIQIVTKYNKSNKVLTENNSNDDDKPNIISNIYTYLEEYIKSSNITDEYKEKVISILFNIEKELKQFERGEI